MRGRRRLGVGTEVAKIDIQMSARQEETCKFHHVTIAQMLEMIWAKSQYT